MVDDASRDQAICQALKAADEIAAALQAHLIAEHGADPDRSADRTTATDSLVLLRQARSRLVPACGPSRPAASLCRKVQG